MPKIRSLPTAAEPSQPTLAESSAHIALPPAHARNARSASRLAFARLTYTRTRSVDHSSLCLSLSPSLPLTLALSLPLSCLPIKQSAIPRSHRSALGDASTRTIPSCVQFSDTTVQRGHARMRKSEGVGGQIAIALYHSRSRTTSARNEGEWGLLLPAPIARPALSIAGCPIQPTTITRGRKTKNIKYYSMVVAIVTAEMHRAHVIFFVGPGTHLCVICLSLSFAYQRDPHRHLGHSTSKCATT